MDENDLDFRVVLSAIDKLTHKKLSSARYGILGFKIVVLNLQKARCAGTKSKAVFDLESLGKLFSLIHLLNQY